MSPTEGKGEFMHRYAEDKRERVASENLARMCGAIGIGLWYTVIDFRYILFQDCNCDGQ
jgi:hypothetical protein